MKFDVLIIEKKCSVCGSKTTTFDKKKKRFYWRKVNGKLHCHKCYMKLRIVFKNKRIRITEKDLTGICQLCGRSVHDGEIKQTQFHHMEYDESNPLKHTKEICVKCHYEVHKETRKRDQSGRFITNAI